MNDQPQDDLEQTSSLDRDPIEELAEEFLQRRRQGEAVSVAEYAERYPQLAPRITDLFPTLVLMEELKPDIILTGVRPGEVARIPPNPIEEPG